MTATTSTSRRVPIPPSLEQMQAMFPRHDIVATKKLGPRDADAFDAAPNLAALKHVPDANEAARLAKAGDDKPGTEPAKRELPDIRPGCAVPAWERLGLDPDKIYRLFHDAETNTTFVREARWEGNKAAAPAAQDAAPRGLSIDSKTQRRHVALSDFMTPTDAPPPSRAPTPDVHALLFPHRHR